MYNNEDDCLDSLFDSKCGKDQQNNKHQQTPCKTSIQDII